MKTFFFSAAIGIALIVGGMLFDRCIEDFSADMLKGCEVLEERIKSGDAKGTADDVESFLNSKKTFLASIINHENLDEIETCITELKGYIASNDIDEASVRCEKLKLLIERLPMEYGLSLQNIL